MRRSAYLTAALLFVVIGLALTIARRHLWDWQDIPTRYRVHLASAASKAWCHSRQHLTGGLSSQYACDVAAAKVEYSLMGYTYKNSIQDYDTYGDWLNCSHTCTWQQGIRFQFDSNGIPIVNYGSGKYYYNPVTIAMYGLAMYGRYLDGDQSAKTRMITAIDTLQRLQDDRGAFLNNFSYETYSPGWASGMAQGLALSLLARAYHMTGDPRYLASGDRAFELLITPTKDGGTLGNLSYLPNGDPKEIVFEEYPAVPPGYTLNGFMYAMLGVYDWSLMPTKESATAKRYFLESLRSLKTVLPYYDLGGFTSYDLEHVVHRKQPTIGANYHAVHVFLLHALGSITHDPVLHDYEQVWASYVPR